METSAYMPAGWTIETACEDISGFLQAAHEAAVDRETASAKACFLRHFSAYPGEEIDISLFEEACRELEVKERDAVNEGRILRGQNGGATDWSSPEDSAGHGGMSKWQHAGV